MNINQIVQALSILFEINNQSKVNLELKLEFKDKYQITNIYRIERIEAKWMNGKIVKL